MRSIISALVFCMLVGVPAADAGRIVVNHDEWTTSNTGFSSAGASATAFVQNVATFLNTSGGAGSFLVYSGNFSLTQSLFANALTAAGHSLTVSTAITVDLPTLLAYDAIFLAGSPSADTTVLTDYVNAGGGVYLAGGTGSFGGATAEANVWNPFLANFGLAFQGGAFNGVGGNLAVSSTHPIFNGVTSLYYNNGSTVVLSGSNPNAQIALSLATAPVGLIGVFDDTTPPSGIPEPTSVLLLGSGVLALALLRRRRFGHR